MNSMRVPQVADRGLSEQGIYFLTTTTEQKVPHIMQRQRSMQTAHDNSEYPE